MFVMYNGKLRIEKLFHPTEKLQISIAILGLSNIMHNNSFE